VTEAIDTEKHKEYAIKELVDDMDTISSELVSNLLEIWYTKDMKYMHTTKKFKSTVKIISQLIVGTTNSSYQNDDTTTIHKAMTVQFTHLLSPHVHTFSTEEWAEVYAWLVTDWLPNVKATMSLLLEGETTDSLCSVDSAEILLWELEDMFEDWSGVKTEIILNKHCAKPLVSNSGDFSQPISESVASMVNLLSSLNVMEKNGKKVDKNIYNYVKQIVDEGKGTIAPNPVCTHKHLQANQSCLEACCKQWMDDVYEDKFTLESYMCGECFEGHKELVDSYDEDEE
jgi:hypothetical protein